MKKSARRLICGVDLGTTKVCSIIAEVDEKKSLNLLGVGVVPSLGLKKGTIVDLKLASKALSESLQRAEKMADVYVDSIILGISGPHLSSAIGYGAVNVISPNEGITVEDKRRVLESSKAILLPPNREVIDIIEREYIVDGQGGIKDPIGMMGKRLEITTSIITGTTTFLKNLVKIVENIGLHVEDIILHSIATAKAVLNEDEKEIGVALIDIGGGTTDLSVFHRGSLCHIKVFPVGSSNIDNDLAVGLSTSHEEAERLKIRYGKAFIDNSTDGSEPIEIQRVGTGEKNKIPLGLLYQIIEPRVSELFSLIYKELETTGYIDCIPSGVVITGGGALLNGLSQLAETKLDTFVRIGYPKGINTFDEKISNPLFATATGIVMSGVEKVSKEREYLSSNSFLTRFISMLSEFFTVFR